MSDPNPRQIAARALDQIAATLEERFRLSKTILSFKEYVELFATNPKAHGRDAATYVRDMFDYFGTSVVQKPWGKVTRFRLFDRPWDGHEAREAPLLGHEQLQGAIYKFLCNFVNEGRANKLILLHGPNGSAKSTTAACILSALEHYSRQDEGALYRFHWVFPSRKSTRGAIGFGDLERAGNRASASESFAHLDEEDIDARLVMELRDHPLFLLPPDLRRGFLQEVFKASGTAAPTWLLSGLLSHKNQQVFAALMLAEHGSLERVLRHVQIERWTISRKYREGAVTLGPELSVDAGERQITADRSLSALPSTLQATTLFEAHGELIDAAGGVLEFSDLLKRPLDAFRYLQLTLETGEIALPHQNIQTNVVMLGSANEVHLEAFRQHPEFPSFRGRFELVAAPYLRCVTEEKQIYEHQIVPFISRPVAPHAVTVAAEFAVMTRLDRPDASRYSNTASPLVGKLTAEQKMDLFEGLIPESFDQESKKILRAEVSAIYRESEASVDYEGKDGASPRTMRTVLLNAAQHPDYDCLSPFSVLAELDELCKQTSEYDWLRRKVQEGGYYDTASIRAVIRKRLLRRMDEELREATGLVDDQRTRDLFERYVQNVSTWVKGETTRNPMTGAHEPADERMMREVEALLGVKAGAEEHRQGLISSIAAWAIEHPGERVEPSQVFPMLQDRIRDAVFKERMRPVAEAIRDLVRVLRSRAEPSEQGAKAGGDLKDLAEGRRKSALAMFERLKVVGYNESSALDAASAVLKDRYLDVGS